MTPPPAANRSRQAAPQCEPRAIATTTTTTTIPTPMPPARGALHAALAAALLVGLAMCALIGDRDGWTAAQLIALAAAAVVAAVPQTRRVVLAWLDRLGGLDQAAARRATLLCFVAALLYLLGTAYVQGRDLIPQWHDHQMTLLQAAMLAHGKLWLPPHPCADFFETFYVFVKPVYAPIYFPGGALAFVPAVWLGIPIWVYSALIAAGVVTLLFRIVARLFDPAAAVVAALLLVSLADTRRVAVWPTSHEVLALLVLAAVLAWMCWREAVGKRRLAWALVIGAAMGWAAATRPVDAVAWGVPLGAAMLWDMRRSGWRQNLATVALMAVIAAPFLSLQLILDHGVTGSWLKTPMQQYAEVELPGLSAYGGHSLRPADVKPSSTLPQKIDFANEFAIPTSAEYFNETFVQGLVRKAKVIARFALPGPIAVVLLPLGLLALRERRRWVLAAAPVIYLTGYLFYPTVLSHYTVVVAPGLVVWLIAAWKACERAFDSPNRFASAFFPLALCALAVGLLPEITRRKDDPNAWPAMYLSRIDLPTKIQSPAVVLFRYHRGLNFHEEPVYNYDAPAIDDNPIIRAHDLGERNVEIARYYAEHQPERHFYLFDRGSTDAATLITPLGTARAYLESLQPRQPPATRP
jgi:hypothetical protein